MKPKEPHSRRAADIALRGGQYFIQPVFRATTGLSLAGYPVTVLAEAISDEELGRAVFEAFERNRANFPPPSSPEQENALLEPLLRAAGVKSWRAFSRGARLVTLSFADKLTIMPLERTSATGAFVAASKAQLEVPVPATDSQVGAAVRQAFEFCR